MIATAVVALAPISIVTVSAPPDVPYFPAGVFDSEDKQHNDSTDAVYSRYLRAMEEPSLSKLAKDDQTACAFRLLWVPSFHHRISVRIVKSGGKFVLHAVELDGKEGEETGKVVVKKRANLTEDQWTWLLVYLERSRFWKTPTSVKMDLKTGIDQDGDQLVYEGVEEGKYHVVDRNGADLGYETICWYMLFLSGLDVKAAWLQYHSDDVFQAIGR